MSIQSNYPFRIARFADKFIITETDLYDKKDLKSLTNNIEEIIEHIILGCDQAEAKRIEIYQYGDDGIFKLDWYLKRKITRDMPPWEVCDVKWIFVSKDIAAFEVLYANK